MPAGPDSSARLARVPGRPCSIAAALALVGEKWSLLAVREIAFGNHRFDAIARNTGAPRDRLAARLRSLEAAGIVRRQRYLERPPRFDYYLTAPGQDLLPVLQAFRTWGDRWALTSPPAAFEHSCGHDLDAALVCRACGSEVRPGELTLRVLAPGWDARGPLPGNRSGSA